MSSAAVYNCINVLTLVSHIVFGGTALQREGLHGLAYAILVVASLGLLVDVVAAGFANRAGFNSSQITYEIFFIFGIFFKFNGHYVIRGCRAGDPYCFWGHSGTARRASRFGFTIRARRLRQGATPNVAAAEWWEEVGEYVLLALVTMVGIVSFMVAINQANRGSI